MSATLSFDHSKKIMPVNEAEVAKISKEAYGCLNPQLRDLGSERDQNFLLQDGPGKSLLKISHPDEDPSVTNIQTAVLQFLQTEAPDFPVPRMLPTLNGEFEYTRMFTDNTSRICRRFSFVSGVVVSSTATTSAQRKSLGRALARLNLALIDFQHPAADHELLWDLSKAHHLHDFVSFVPENIRPEVEATLAYFTTNLLPVMPGLRCQFIHGDFHPGNVFCDPADPSVITGVIDFGDCLKAPLINDLAILCAYHVGLENPLVPLGDIVSAYNHVLALTAEEIAMLHGLISTRLAMRIVINRYYAAQQSDKLADFIGGEAETVSALQRMQNISSIDATKFFMQCLKQEQI